MRRPWTVLALAACLAAVPAGARADEAKAEAELVNAKCTLCHTTMRIYTAETKNLQEVVDRMTAKNPEWFKGVDSRHLIDALAAMTQDPKVAAQRQAWEEAVSRGRDLFADRSLGSSGKSCLDCHPEGSLGRRVKDQYPKYNEVLGRLEGLEERLASMIVTKLGGSAPAPDDPRLTDLALYLRSLR